LRDVPKNTAQVGQFHFSLSVQRPRFVIRLTAVTNEMFALGKQVANAFKPAP
jgi:hypothetical protein